MKSILPIIIGAFLLLSFTIVTLPYSEVLDNRDGMLYGAVKIGDIEVMVKNLHFDSNSASCYDHLDRYCEHYGNLYHFNGYEREVAGGKTFCPEGWRIPTVKEWEYLLKRMNPKVSYDANRNFKYTISHNYARLQLGGFKSHQIDKYYNMGRQGHYFTSTKSDDGKWATLMIKRIKNTGEYEVRINRDTPSGRAVSCRCIRGEMQY